MIPHNRPTVGREEAEAAYKVITSAELAQGKEVSAFENELCNYLGYGEGHAAAVSSGSAALYMAIRALDYIKSIKTVAIPAYSCVALKNAVILAKKDPKYSDVGVNTPNIDLHSDEVLSSDAVIACHMFGMPLQFDRDSIIEDCAQAIGASVDGIKVGTQTIISIFSFYATKPITCGGEGGMVFSKDKDLIDYIKDLRDFDMKSDDIERFNLKMTDLQASIGRIQLKKLDSFIDRRRYLADRYQSNGIPLWNRSEGGIDYRGLIKSGSPSKLISYLRAKEISSIVPVEENELLCKKESIPNALCLTHSLVSIPLYPSLKNTEQDKIITALKEYMYSEGRL